MEPTSLTNTSDKAMHTRFVRGVGLGTNPCLNQLETENTPPSAELVPHAGEADNGEEAEAADSLGALASVWSSSFEKTLDRYRRHRTATEATHFIRRDYLTCGALRRSNGQYYYSSWRPRRLQEAAGSVIPARLCEYFKTWLDDGSSGYVHGWRMLGISTQCRAYE